MGMRIMSCLHELSSVEFVSFGIKPVLDIFAPGFLLLLQVLSRPSVWLPDHGANDSVSGKPACKSRSLSSLGIFDSLALPLILAEG